MNALNIKLLSLTYKVLTTSQRQPDYLHNLISVQSTGRTRSSSAVTLAQPSVSSLLQITNRSFRYASPYLRNQLLSSFRQPHVLLVHLLLRISPHHSYHPSRSHQRSCQSIKSTRFVVVYQHNSLKYDKYMYTESHKNM